jgi:hypothetical protein
MFIINVTQSTFPLTVEFDACQILPWRPYIPTPALRVLFLYVSQLGTHREAWYLSRVDGCGVKLWV